MKATINGITVEGTPVELVEYTRLSQAAEVTKQIPLTNGETNLQQITGDLIGKYFKSVGAKKNGCGNESCYCTGACMAVFPPGYGPESIKYEKQNENWQVKIMGMGEVIGDTKNHVNTQGEKPTYWDVYAVLDGGDLRLVEHSVTNKEANDLVNNNRNYIKKLTTE